MTYTAFGHSYSTFLFKTDNFVFYEKYTFLQFKACRLLVKVENYGKAWLLNDEKFSA